MNLEGLIHTINSIDEAKFMLKKLAMLALNKGITAAQKEYLNNELECELEQIEKDYYVQQQIVQQIINSGEISNECVQQLLLYNQPITTTNTQQNSNDPTQPRMLCNNGSVNGSFMMNGGGSGGYSASGAGDNFEIDEIILAPMIDGILLLMSFTKIIKNMFYRSRLVTSFYPINSFCNYVKMASFCFCSKKRFDE